MTKEELKQEAEEYLHKDGTEAEKLVKDIGMLCLTKKQLNGFFAIFKQIYIDSAEPREKQIAELEKENAELRKDKKELCHSISEGGKACVYLNEQLTKAKKLLKQFLEAKNGEDTYKAEWEAEQFLKESEQ